MKKLPKCPFSMSKKHSFEHDVWRVVGEVPVCRWCGLADDRELEDLKKNSTDKRKKQVRL